MNTFIATGILTTTPKDGTSENNQEYLYFHLSAPRSYGGTCDKSDQFECYVYDQQRIKWAKKHLVKNQRILVQGNIRTSSEHHFFVLISHIELAGSSRYKDILLEKGKSLNGEKKRPDYVEATPLTKVIGTIAGKDEEVPF